ncbi:hypothetical protein AKO1_015793 [Acrasis kona]|uniref:Uncharacterized protein n=1 Tax=Acrasis kona TaxID=1008807 RepID=A0AAW2ZGS9_9EUKA
MNQLLQQQLDLQKQSPTKSIRISNGKAVKDFLAPSKLTLNELRKSERYGPARTREMDDTKIVAKVDNKICDLGMLVGDLNDDSTIFFEEIETEEW